MNLHESPAVQVEALLALTTIAELCQHTYYQQSSEGISKEGSSVNGSTDSKLGELPITPPPYHFPFPGQPFPPNAMAHSSHRNGATLPFPTHEASSKSERTTHTYHDGAEVQSGFVSKKFSFNNSSMPNIPLPPPPHNMPPNFPGGPPWSQQHMSMMAGSMASFPPFSMSSSISNDPNMSSSQLPLPAQMMQSIGGPSPNAIFRHAEAIPTLISLLSSPNREVHEQAMWILGSFASGDSWPVPGSMPPGSVPTSTPSLVSENNEKMPHASPKEAILAAGVMEPLQACLEASPENVSLQRIGSWAISNLVETKMHQGKGSNKSSISSQTSDNHANTIKMRSLMPTLTRLLSSTDADTLSYICWALSHLCDGPTTNITYVVTYPTDIKGGLVPRLVQLLSHTNWKVIKPALRTIGNIVCAEIGDENNNYNHPSDWTNSDPAVPCDFTNVIVEADAVPRLKGLISHTNKEIQKEACWTLSNIAAGNIDQIQAVIDSGAISPLVRVINDKNTDQEVRSEACWVVLNATSCGSDRQVETLVSEGCVSVLTFLLEESTMVTMALEGLERVLQVEEKREFERKDNDRAPTSSISVSMIQKALEKHNGTNAVSKRANRIWKQHFVSCALCKQSFSRHRAGDVKFCTECKCHVCCRCNCEVYHLTYQEELWAATEEQNEASKQAKKSKKQKKKEKKKEKKGKQQDGDKVEGSNQVHVSTLDIDDKVQRNLKARSGPEQSRSSTVSSSSESGSVGALRSGSNRKTRANITTVAPIPSTNNSKSVGLSSSDPLAAKKIDERQQDTHITIESRKDVDQDQSQAPVDFVLYLQQTGSIIALARLMDALDCRDISM